MNKIFLIFNLDRYFIFKYKLLYNKRGFFHLPRQNVQ